MFGKLLLVLVTMAATGAALLGMRADRLAAEHEIAKLHRAIDENRRAVWDAQVRVADAAGPEALRETLAGTGLEFEAVVEPMKGPERGSRYAAASADGR